MGNRRKRTVDRRSCETDDMNPDRIAFPDSHETRMMVAVRALIRCVVNKRLTRKNKY